MKQQRGFSLIEMMVATALAMLTGLAVLQVLSNFQTRQQTTSARNDSQLSAAIGLYQLETEIRMAGAGLITSQGFICNVGINTYRGAAVSNGAPLLPLRITNGSGSTPDQIDIIRSNARTGSAPATVLQAPNAVTTKIQVDSTTGLSAGDLYIVGSNDGSKVCTLQQLDVAPENNVTSWFLHHDAAVAAPYNPADPATVFTAPVTYDVGDMIVAIGNAWETEYRVLCSDNANPGVSNNCNLVSYDRYNPPANMNLASVTSLAGQIYDLQAQYGIADTGSQTVNAWVDATGTWSAASLTNANIRRIKAVRVALIARGAKQATSVAPEQLVLWGTGTDQRVRTLTTAERFYRYTVLTTVIPLVNVIWAGM